MRVHLEVVTGDQKVEVVLTPETYDLVADDKVVSTVGPTARQLIEKASSMAIAALESK